jgi:hypothetical protein
MGLVGESRFAGHGGDGQTLPKLCSAELDSTIDDVGVRRHGVLTLEGANQ